LILASGSPRRHELLARLGIPFEIRRADTDETPRPGESPETLVVRLAVSKALGAARADETVLGADTVVALDGQLLGKPVDEADARRMLRRLSGRVHQVWTGVAVSSPVADGRREQARAACTEVRFRALDDTEIEAYVASGEPADKAGAYAIQGAGGGFVEQIDGDYDNVVGLPLRLVVDLLRATGVAVASPADSAAVSRRP
jgi:septum formation protein